MSKTFDFSYFPVLETSRLVLRELSLEDTAAVFRIRGDYEVTKYNIGSAYARADQAASMIESVQYGFREGTELRWGIVLKASEALINPEQAGEVIGVCGYNYWDRRDHRGSIGYDLARAYWGRGYMPEALTAIIRFGFEHMGLNRIEADASIHNTASTRVLEKLGFMREGIQREQYFEDGRYHDLCLFGLIRRDWEQEK
ncbi:MAG: GNAT family protein [bacterium]|nr:GNAT family protein [bacterium]